MLDVTATWDVFKNAIFIYLLTWESEENMDLLFHPFIHSLVDSLTGDQTHNPGTLGGCSS